MCSFRRCNLLLSVLLLLYCGVANAQNILFNSLQAGDPAPGYCVGAPYKMAVVLDVPVGSNRILSEITWSLSYENVTPSADFQLAVYADAGSMPGAMIGSYWSQQTPWSSFPSLNDVITSGGDVTFTPSSPVTLQAGQKYWVVGGFTDLMTCDGFVRQGGNPNSSGILQLSGYIHYYAATGSPYWQPRSTPTSIKLVEKVLSLTDDNYIVPRTVATLLNITSNDDAGVGLDSTFSLVLSNPAAGTLGYQGNQILFTPNSASFTSPVSFTYKACKTGFGCANASVTLNPSSGGAMPTPVPFLGNFGLWMLGVVVIFLGAFRIGAR